MEFLERSMTKTPTLTSGHIKLGLEALYKATGRPRLQLIPSKSPAIYAEDHRFKKLSMDDLEAYVKLVLEFDA